MQKKKSLPRKRNRFIKKVFLISLISLGVVIVFSGIAYYLLASLLWTISITVLCANLVLQFITDVWNLRWTAIALLVHIPILVVILR